MTDPSKNDNEQNDVKQTLKESEQLYKALLRTSPDAITVSDLKGRIIDVSQRAIELAGAKSADELIGKNSFELLAPEDRERAMQNLLKTLNTGFIQDVEYYFLRLDGSKYLGEINASVIKDAEGKPKAFIGTVRDITKRKEAEKALKKSEELYRNLYKSALVGLWTIRFHDGVFIRANITTAKILGFDNVEDIINKVSSIDLFKPNIIQKFRSQLKERGKISGYEAPFTDINGKEKIISVSATIYKKLGIIEGAFIDITDLKRAQKALSESHNMLKLVMDNIPQHIFWKNRDSVYMGSNINFARVAGVENPENIVGKTDYDLAWKKEESDYFREIDRRVIESDTPEYGSIEPIREASGKQLWVDANRIPIHDSEGNVVGIIGMYEDITKKMETEQKLEESEEKFRTIAEQSLMGISIIQDDVIKYLNQAFEQMTGYDAAEVKNWGPGEFSKRIHPEDIKIVMEQVKKKQEGSKDVITHYQYRVFKKNDELVWIDNYSKTINYNGKPADLITAVDITERKKAEQELKDSEQQYHTTIDSLIDPLHVINKEYEIILVNEPFINWLDELGIKKNIMGKKVFEAFPFLSEIVQDEYQQVFESGEPLISVESTIVNNTEIITETRKFPINSEGIVSQVITIVRDITERKKVEQKLKDSEERYRHLFETTPLSIILINSKGLIIDCNTATEKLYGYSREELIGREYKILTLEHPKYRPEFLEKVMPFFKGKNPPPIDIELYNKSGNLIWVNMQTTTVKIGNEELKQIISHNISERKKAEQDLIESEEKYRSILENIKEGYFEVDLKGDFTFTNDSFCDLIGYSREDIIGMNFSELVEAKNAMKVYKHYNSIYKSETEEMNIEYEAIKKNGDKIYVDTGAYLRYDSEGNKIGFYGLGRDITKRKEAELLIEEEIKKLKELDAIRKDLISRVSHELKTPLIPVIGGAELLLEKYRDGLGKEPLEIIELIEKGGNRLSILVNKLLDVSRIDFKKIKLDKQKTDFGILIKNCVKDMQYFLSQRNIELKMKLPERFILEIDIMRFEQVITNLISNAIKNSPPNSKIDILLEKYENWAIFSVSDPGVGLTENEIKKLFTRFGKIERYEPGLEYLDIQGSGLGLYISKEIVDLHGGKIWADSDGRNKGATFTVRLPIK